LFVCIIFSEIFLTDPTNEEESLSSGIVTVVVQGDVLCSVHKPGGSALTESQLQECISGATNRAQYINKLVNTALKSLNT
jgi:exosome complex component RRP43